jgi:hypothetical protein
MTDPMDPRDLPVAAPAVVDTVTDASVDQAVDGAVDAATDAATGAMTAAEPEVVLLRRFEPVLRLTSGEPPGGC